MSLRRRFGGLTVAGAAAIGLITVAAPVAQAYTSTHTLVLTQQPASLRPIEGGAPGSSVGDMLLFEAPISGEHGESGTLTGFLIQADIPDAETGDLDADRLGQLSYDLGDGNTLVVIGETIYRGENTEITVNQPQLRVVAGGTGTFLGSRGQVLTTRNADGTYRHEFTLIDD